MAEDEKKDPAPEVPMDFRIEVREEGEFRKGSFVAPHMSLPDGVELPSLAPIPENPAVIVEPVQSAPIEVPPAATDSKDE